jgi:DNA modification methylase
MKLPVHRWFRYSAGFSAEWVKEVVTEFKARGAVTLFDPFAGSGTALLAGQECGVRSCGIEAHRFVARVARAKLLWREQLGQFSRFAETMLRGARQNGGTTEGYPSLIGKCFPEEILLELDALKQAWVAANDGSAAAELCWLALTAILRACSPVGTAQMELIQPRKRKQSFSRPFEAFPAQVGVMLSDMRFFQRRRQSAEATIYEDDARSCRVIEDGSVNLVITSPPYVNNFDYADATRLEMTFWGELRGWGDLQAQVRRHLIRSCSQHMSAQRESIEQLLAGEPELPMRGEVQRVCDRLDQERLGHGGKKNYHLMVAAYFSDMARVWSALRRVCMPGSLVCFVVGDSAPYGIYVPVHQWLGEIATAAGFRSFRFEKTRDRNIKWKNRKHRVPLCEGRLWVEG